MTSGSIALAIASRMFTSPPGRSAALLMYRMFAVLVTSTNPGSLSSSIPRTIWVSRICVTSVPPDRTRSFSACVVAATVKRSLSRYGFPPQ